MLNETLSQQYQQLYKTIIGAHSFGDCMNDCSAWSLKKGYVKMQRSYLLYQIEKAGKYAEILDTLKIAREELKSKGEEAAWQRLQQAIKLEPKGKQGSDKCKIIRSIAHLLFSDPNSPGFQLKDNFPKALDTLEQLYAQHWSQKLAKNLPELLAVCKEAAARPEKFITLKGDTVIVDGKSKDAPMAKLEGCDAVQLRRARMEESGFDWNQPVIKKVILRNLLVYDGMDAKCLYWFIDKRYEIDSDAHINPELMEELTESLKSSIAYGTKVQSGSRIIVPVLQSYSGMARASNFGELFIKLGFTTNDTF